MSNKSNGLGFLTEDYQALFQKQWTPWVGGILLGLLNVMMFAYAKPWAVAEGVQNWGLWVLKWFGFVEGDLSTPWQFTTSVTTIALLFGAMIAALLSKEFAFRFTYRRDVVRALIGGALLGIGSVLGIGCTIGGFFSAYAALSLAGPLMMIGLGIGAYIGLRILLWDLARENTPAQPATTSGGDRSIQPYIGLALIGVVVLLLLFDDTTFTAGQTEGLRSVLVLFGVLLGIVNQRARFCFVRAFREPFMTGEGAMTKGAVLALLVGVVGFSIIKGTDLSDMRDPLAGVNPSVFLGSLLGGIIFGIGMILTGGCASGSLWRAGEGQMKLWVVLAMFAIFNAITNRVLIATGWRSVWGDTAVFMPDSFGWTASIAILVGLALAWAVLIAWNERSEKMVIS